MSGKGPRTNPLFRGAQVESLASGSNEGYSLELEGPLLPDNLQTIISVLSHKQVPNALKPSPWPAFPLVSLRPTMVWL